MSEIIKRFLMKWSCSHKWELCGKTPYKYTGLFISISYEKHTMICQKCGNIKRIKI